MKKIKINEAQLVKVLKRLAEDSISDDEVVRVLDTARMCPTKNHMTRQKRLKI